MRSSVPWSRAFAELVVIVVGILVALGTDSWWQGLQEKRVEQEYLHALRENVLETMRENDRVTVLQSEIQRTMLNIDTRIRDRSELPDTLRRIFPTVTIPAESMDTYRDLVASGGTTHITNRDVRRAMSNLLARVEYNDRAESWALALITSTRMIVLATDPGSLDRERLGEIWSVYVDAGERLLDGLRRWMRPRKSRCKCWTASWAAASQEYGNR